MFDRLRPIVFACGLMIAVGAPVASASDNPEFDAAIHDLVTRWENVMFGVPAGARQTELMGALNKDADATVAKYPDRLEAVMWDGIITAEHASMTRGTEALHFAKAARVMLEKAHAHDPAALEAGATTALGVLYYRVPGWPIGFGDTNKARDLLEQATKLAPVSLDAWYFYGDFLYREAQYAEATVALEHALTIPPRPNRRLWDSNRRRTIEALLSDIQKKS